jgi:protoporphyrinogen oxidase
MPNHSPISVIGEETLRYNKTGHNKGVLSCIIPSIKKLSKKELLNIILEELNKMFTIDENDVVRLLSYHWEYGLPICSPEFHSILYNLRQLDNNGLYLNGDYMSIPSLDGAIESSKFVVKRMVEDLK